MTINNDFPKVEYTMLDGSGGGTILGNPKEGDTIESLKKDLDHKYGSERWQEKNKSGATQ
jgi:hypothetical protein